MKINKFVVAVALCAGVVFGIGDAKAGIISTQKNVEPGVWSSDFDAALAYADKYNVPVFVFWGNVGCSHCEAVETAMKKEPFTSWAADKNIVMVFVEGNAKVKSWIKAAAAEKISAFPYAGVYWPKNSNGQEVKVGFSAYKGNMGAYGAKSTDSNIDQLIDALNYLIGDWDPSGVVPVDPTPVDPTPVDPVVDRTVITPAKFFNKTKKLEAIAYNDGNFFGKVTITIAKYNSRKGTIKVTTKIDAFGGATYSKYVNAIPNEYGDLLGMEFGFKSPVDDVELDLVNNEGSFEISGVGESTTIESGDVVIGGKLESTEMMLTVDIPDFELDNEDYSMIIDLPGLAEATITSGTKFNFGKAPSIKYNRVREDGYTWYELNEWDSETAPNANSVKVTYKYLTGAISGSFKVYASNEASVDEGKKPTIKTYTGKLSGVVVDGIGRGTATIKVGRTTFTGTFALE